MVINFFHIVCSCFIFVPSIVNISKTAPELSSGHDFHTIIYEGAYFRKHVSGVTVHILCTLSDDALYLYKVL